jgi:hypothetical protein
VRSFHLEKDDPFDPQVIGITWGMIGLAVGTTLASRQYVLGALIVVCAIPRLVFHLTKARRLDRPSNIAFAVTLCLAIYILGAAAYAKTLHLIGQ